MTFIAIVTAILFMFLGVKIRGCGILRLHENKEDLTLSIGLLVMGIVGMVFLVIY